MIKPAVILAPFAHRYNADYEKHLLRWSDLISRILFYDVYTGNALFSFAVRAVFFSALPHFKLAGSFDISESLFLIRRIQDCFYFKLRHCQHVMWKNLIC